MDEETTLIISSLSSLPPSHLSDVTFSVLSATHLHRRRLSALLSYPALFSVTLRHLHSLSLPAKSLLIARHLLSSLRLLTSHLDPAASLPPPPIRLRDLDAALLLLLLCDTRHHDPDSLRGARPSEWRLILRRRCSEDALSISGIEVCRGGVLIPYVESVSRCWRFVSGTVGAGGTSKAAREVAASPAAVVALPSVEVTGGMAECTICREEMTEGRDVCELPCRHRYHWLCVLPWLRKRNTCPCCRFQLPTDDVVAEIQRLWNLLSAFVTNRREQ